MKNPKLELKKIVHQSLIIVMTLLFFLISFNVTRAQTVGTYDINSVISYAKNHYNDFENASSNGDCIQFVRECLESGGVPKDSDRNYGYTVQGYMQYLTDNGYAQSYNLTVEQQNFSNGIQWYVRQSDNIGKLSVGDVIIYHCNKCGNYFHASIVTDIDNDDFARYSAQNVAVDNQPLCLIDCSKCGENRKNTELYSMHITSTENGYSKKFNDKTVSDLKVTRYSENSHVISWKSVDGAVGYKVFKKNGATSVFNQLMDVTDCTTKYTEEIVGANYYFAVRPYFEENGKIYVGKLSNTVKTDEINETKLSSPKAVSAVYQSDTGKIRISWNKVLGAKKYEVYRAYSKDGKYTKILTLTGTSCTNSSITPGKTYYYKIKAIDDNNDAYNSEYSNVIYATCYLSQPEASIAVVSETGKLKVSWNRVEGADKYEVWRKVGDSGVYKKYYTTTGTRVTNVSAKAGTIYYYKVLAISSSNSTANSSFSNEVYGTCKLTSPTLNLNIVLSSGKPNITWSKVEGANKYEVWRKVGDSGVYKKYYTTTGTKLTNTSAVVGTKYYYKVRAIFTSNSDANSEFSNSSYTVCACAKPVVSITLNSAGKPRLSWTKVSGASKYYIYRSASYNGKYSYLGASVGSTFTNTSATKGKTYYYKVKAICDKNSNGNSMLSTVRYIKSK